MIRVAEKSDLFEVQTLTHDAYAKFVPRLGQKPAPMTQDFASHVKNHRLFVLRDGDLQGYIVCYPEDDTYRVDNVAVSPKHQRHGVGRRLLLFAESRALEAGCNSLSICTNVAMNETVDYYKRLGFHEVGRTVEDGLERAYFKMQLR